jgi:hypothetical protein
MVFGESVIGGPHSAVGGKSRASVGAGVRGAQSAPVRESRQGNRNLKANPMSPMEAAKVVCEAHTRTITGERGFTVDWGAPARFHYDRGGYRGIGRGQMDDEGRTPQAATRVAQQRSKTCRAAK